MIQIVHKQDCCGCWACVQRCANHCISMYEDEEGFLYPQVDLSTCTQCGLCERVCPVLNQNEHRMPLRVFAAKNYDEEIRMQSSSGGIFSLLAEAVIEEGGVVFGARFDADWNVIHAYTETIEGIAHFRGSKYVQSQMGSCYQQTETFLKAGRKVLFSGTSCQIAGLHKYLMKMYENLLTVDVVCHGVPSPMVWQEYLRTITCPDKDGASLLNKRLAITNISFRDKSTGWKKFGFVVRGKRDTKDTLFLHETMDKNMYMQLFLNNLSLRPSCYHCIAKSGKSGSDITIGDYWKIGKYHRMYDDNKGVGLLMANTEKGINTVKRLSLDSHETTYQQALVGNSTLEKSVEISPYRAEFWDCFKTNGIDAVTAICKKMRPSFVSRCIKSSKGIIKHIIGQK